MNNFANPSQRQLRVGEQIRQIISDCFIRNIVPDKDLIDIYKKDYLENLPINELKELFDQYLRDMSIG